MTTICRSGMSRVLNRAFGPAARTMRGIVQGGWLASAPSRWRRARQPRRPRQPPAPAHGQEQQGLGESTRHGETAPGSKRCYLAGVPRRARRTDRPGATRPNPALGPGWAENQGRLGKRGLNPCTAQSGLSLRPQTDWRNASTSRARTPRPTPPPRQPLASPQGPCAARRKRAVRRPPKALRATAGDAQSNCLYSHKTHGPETEV